MRRDWERLVRVCGVERGGASSVVGEGGVEVFVEKANGSPAHYSKGEEEPRILAL